MIKGKVNVATETTISYENHFSSSCGAIGVSADYREGVLRAYLSKASGSFSGSPSMSLEESDVPRLIELLQDFHKFIEMHGNPQKEADDERD